jgi:hypothetical protein
MIWCRIETKSQVHNRKQSRGFNCCYLLASEGHQCSRIIIKYDCSFLLLSILESKCVCDFTEMVKSTNKQQLMEAENRVHLLQACRTSSFYYYFPFLLNI